MNVEVFDSISISEGPTLFCGRTLYWVGGTAIWDATAGTKWSLTSGGAGGEAIPTDRDNVYFNAASGSGVVTVSTGAVARTIDCTGFTGTLGGSTDFSVHGSLYYATGMTASYSGEITMAATTIGHIFSTQNCTINGDFKFNGEGGEWTFGSDFTAATNKGTIDLAKGTLSTAGYSINNSISFSSSGSGTRTFNANSSILEFYNWTSTTTNFTFNAGTSSITGLGATFSPGGLTFYDVSYDQPRSSDDRSTISGNNSYHNLSISASASAFKHVLLSGTQTVTNILSLNGSSATNRLFLQSATIGTTATLSAANVSMSYVDFRDITGSGAGSWTGTSIGDGGGNSGITFTTPVTRYAVAAGSWSSTSIWSATSGGASGASVPLLHDTVYLNAATGSGNINTILPRIAADIDCTGYTGTLTLSSLYDVTSIYGDLTLSAGMTLTHGSERLDFFGRGAQSITLAGKTLYETRLQTGTYTLQDDYTGAGDLHVLALCEFDANNNDVTATAFLSNSGTPTVTMGSGNWTVNGSDVVWEVAAATTLNAETSRVILDAQSTAVMTMKGGDKTYNNLRVSGNFNNTYNLVDHNTFNVFDSTKTSAFTVLFEHSGTHTFADWQVSGSSGNLATIGSCTNDALSSLATHTLLKTGGGFVSEDYLNIQHSIATPTNTWFAGLNSTNNQSVPTAGSGWDFNVTPTLLSTFDSISITENVSSVANAFTAFLVSESLSIAENVSVSRTITLSLSDTVTVTDSATVALGSLLVSAFDALSITEDVETLYIDLGTFAANVFEAITLTEETQREVGIILAVNDTFTVTEYAGGAIALITSVFDAVTISESTSSDFSIILITFDLITVSESQTLSVVHAQSVSDSLSLSEYLEIEHPVYSFQLPLMRYKGHAKRVRVTTGGFM